MTREEAIVLFEKQLTAAQVVLDSGFGSNPGENDSLYRRRKEMAEIALSALRPVRRERAEKVFSGCINCHDKERLAKHIHCWPSFCPVCGKPLTDEAVDMMLERWKEAVVDEA